MALGAFHIDGVEVVPGASNWAASRLAGLKATPLRPGFPGPGEHGRRQHIGGNIVGMPPLSACDEQVTAKPFLARSRRVRALKFAQGGHALAFLGHAQRLAAEAVGHGEPVPGPDGEAPPICPRKQAASQGWSQMRAHAGSGMVRSRPCARGKVACAILVIKARMSPWMGQRSWHLGCSNTMHRLRWSAGPADSRVPSGETTDGTRSTSAVAV